MTVLIVGRTQAGPGTTYLISVSAVSEGGNKSLRSEPVPAIPLAQAA